MDIYFVRHGETQLNLEKRFYGSLDVSVNQTGAAQSLMLRKKLCHLRDLPVYATQLKRTQETAALIFPEKQQIQTLPGFNEKGFGLWEGLTANEIQQQFPQAWETWLAHPFDYTPPEAEAFSSFRRRVLSEMAMLEALNASLVCVSHLGTIRTILHHWFPQKIFWEIQLDQGNYTWIHVNPQGYKINAWNC